MGASSRRRGYSWSQTKLSLKPLSLKLMVEYNALGMLNRLGAG